MLNNDYIDKIYFFIKLITAGKNFLIECVTEYYIYILYFDTNIYIIRLVNNLASIIMYTGE